MAVLKVYENIINSNIPIVDVRSPIEYHKAHITHAYNVPLFSDTEREIVGTIYKNEGKEKAVLQGLKFVGNKLDSYVDYIKKITDSKKLILHCWRGGKRSSSMAWLLELFDYEIIIIQNGYKSYRNFVLKYLESVNLNLIVLGGKTGSGKTVILQELKNRGEQVIDLEKLANHKGSAFGWIGETQQGSVEQFENDLFFEISKLDLTKRIWIENESRSIGKIYIPNGIWKNMNQARLVHLDIDLSSRVENLLSIYKTENPEDLIKSFDKIKKKLGHENFSKAVEFVETRQLVSAIEIALSYYDKCYNYDYNNSKNSQILTYSASNQTAKSISENLIELINNYSSHE